MFSSIIQHSSDSITLLDYKGIILYQNDAVSRILGYTPEEHTGKDALSLVHPDDVNRIKQFFNELISSSPKYIELRVKHKSGHWVWIEASGQPLIDKGASNSIVINAREISRRKKLEKSLEHSKNNLEIINQSMLDMLEMDSLQNIYKHIINTLTDYIPKTIILYVSIDEEEEDTVLEEIGGLKKGMWSRILSLIGFNPIGKHFKLLPGHYQVFRSSKLTAIEGGLAGFSGNQFPAAIANSLQKIMGIHNIYTVGITKNHQLFSAIHFFTLSHYEIEDSCFIETFVRQAGIIIQKKMAEESLRQKEMDLMRINMTKDKFLNIISHDLRSPFNTLVGFSELLKNRYYQYNDEKRLNQIELIHEYTQYAYNLLEELLLWSKSQSGNIRYRPENFDVPEMIQRILKEEKIRAETKSVQLSYHGPSELECVTDRNMLSITIRNLVSNAIKFVHPHGSVAVEAAPYQNGIKISVTDNGVGISKEDLAEIWKLDHIYTTKGTNGEKGTGLGLHICKEMVKQQGGEISVTSNPGVETKFTIIIPCLPK